MDALNEYQKKNKSGDEWSKERKMGDRASKAETNTQKAFSTEQFLKIDKVKTNNKPTRRGFGERTPLSGGVGGTRPPRDTSGGGSGSDSGGSSDGSSGKRSNSGDTGYSGKPGEARQQATVTRGNRNRGTETGGIRNTGGRGTTPTPRATSAKPKRSDYGPGRIGAAAYNRAMTKWQSANKPETKEKKVNRRGRRVN